MRKDDLLNDMKKAYRDENCAGFNVTLSIHGNNYTEYIINTRPAMASYIGYFKDKFNDSLEIKEDKHVCVKEWSICHKKICIKRTENEDEWE